MKHFGYIITLLFALILVGIFFGIAPYQHTPQAQAVSTNGLSLVGANDISGDCSNVQTEIRVQNRLATTDDGAGFDYYHLVVYDGTGLPHYSSSKQAAVTGFPNVINVVVSVNEVFYFPIAARPLKVVMYDTTSGSNLNLGAIESSPVVASTMIDPAGFAASCGALPFIEDPRVNKVIYEPYQTAAVFCIRGSIEVYAVDPITSNGTLVIRVTAREIDDIGIPENEHLLLGTSPDGNVRLYRLTTGYFQVNAPLNNVRDGYVVLWAGCP
jgi:hypothetical protein